MSNNIYTILVAYNPDNEHLNRSIELLLKQTDMIVVCNNSSLDIEFNNHFIKVFNFGTNHGIAKAQNIGMQWAFDNGANFVLQMDQDSLVTDKMVNTLLNAYHTLIKLNKSPGLVGPLESDIDSGDINCNRIVDGTKIKHQPIWKVDETISSGSLIPAHVFEKCGGNDERLFIDLVDIEYCWRIQSKGYNTYVCTNALLSHKLGNGKKVKYHLPIGDHAPIRYYYQTRNLLLSLSYPHAPIIWKLTVIPRIIKTLFLSPFLLNNGKERVFYILKGIQAAVFSKYGKLEE